jgi:hypothetical protein
VRRPGYRLSRRTSGIPWPDLWPLPVRVIDEWTGGMSGNAFAGDQVLVEVSFDAARCQLRRLASDGVLLGASKCAYLAGSPAWYKRPDPRQHCPRLAGVEPADLAETAGSARLWLRWHATGPGSAVFPALDADLTFSPAGGADHGPRGGRGIPAARPGGSRAGPGHGALPRRGDYLQLHRPARLRPHPSGRHSGSGRPHATCLPAGAHHRPGYVQATGSPGRTPPAAPPGQRSRARGTLAGGMRSRGGVDWLLTREPQADAE